MQADDFAVHFGLDEAGAAPHQNLCCIYLIHRSHAA
jgi:hypothetical protein